MRAGMVLVKHDEVFIGNTRRGGTIEVCSKREVRWGRYSGVVMPNGREISWNSGKITWTFIGALPDEHDAETNQGRWRYEAFLGKGSSGCVYSVMDMRATQRNGDPPRKFAVKVLRAFQKSARRRCHEVFRLHREFQWSRLRLHNKSHEKYSREQGRLIVKYLEDHTGFPSNQELTLHTPEVWLWLKGLKDIPSQPYVVMELDSGQLLWEAFAKTQFTFEEKCKIIQQCATALEYMGKFQLMHRDLRFQNICVSRTDGDCNIKILDLGRMSDRTDPEGYVFSPGAEAHWLRRDWIPWEAWVLESKPKERTLDTGGALADHSFDVFSMGVILLYLCVGQAEARLVLEKIRRGEFRIAPEQARKLILDSALVLKMVSKDPAKRPAPSEVLRAFGSKRRKLN